MPHFELERALIKTHGNILVAGVDEVGRGPLAGPIVAAAVVLAVADGVPDAFGEINDSKKLTAKKREKLDGVIRSHALDLAIGSATSEEIDLLGITKANRLAFERAVRGLQRCNHALIDGLDIKDFVIPYSCHVRGESISLSIAAASIVAKVYRDSLMTELAYKYPEYDFASNKGYGTAKHMEALKKYGPTKIHRKSFLRFM